MVSYSTNMTFVCVLTVLVCWRLLGLFDFTTNQKIAGVFALLFCTTFLHYTQNMMENNYILLLTLTGLTFQYEWLKTGSARALLIGALALGANLLTRLTTAMDLFAVLLFLLITAWLTGIRGIALRARFSRYLKLAFPVYVAFFLMDRAYQYYRFGSFTNTYIQLFGREQKLLNPAFPAAYPFETPFHIGFRGRSSLPKNPSSCLTLFSSSRRSSRPSHGSAFVSIFARTSSLRSCSSWDTSASTQRSRTGTAISLGVTATYPPPRKWPHSSPFRF